ncbi:hypothetical protein BJY24_006186 [Nocardia transvalensis]|uniref:Secreted protein n=1 Tax=Nocardia transvalensis TaxID=37333 RepID=A0A7W9PJE8_9NOCA|nr:hypothetical protein [Nocardia transvalensis]MBB5917274.1 hypothetical protein [Nocardia transvalensis]
MIGSRSVGMIAALVVSAGVMTGAGTAQAGPADCAAGNPLRIEAELFATDNTATITDPGDDRLRNRLEAFELQVDGMALGHLTLPVGSTLVSGVFWSDTQRQATYERSREFHLACVSGPALHDLADQVRTRFGQESVLTFEPLPADSPARDAFTVEVPGIGVTRFHDALVADPEVRDRLVGGSVTENDTLILVADLADLPLVGRFVTGLGATWDPAAVRYGDREFVD